MHSRWPNLLLFFFCFAILLGPAYALFDSYNYDLVANPDIKNYLGLANFEFDQNPTRKYRVIIPFLAGGINYVFGPVFSALAPQTFPGPDFSLCLSFLLVNCAFMALFGMLVYRLCKSFGVSSLAAIVGLLSVMTCRWSSYIAGLPLIDSLYMVVIAMTLLGLKTQNAKLITAAIFLGPWAKESFIFFAPLIFFFSSIPKWKQAGLFLLSGLIVFTFRYFFDQGTIGSIDLGLKNDFAHVDNINEALKRLFSFHGVYEIFSIMGVWGLLFMASVNQRIRESLRENTKSYIIFFLVIVFIHALLSVELARMFYLATPVLAVFFSIIADRILSMGNFQTIS